MEISTMDTPTDQKEWDRFVYNSPHSVHYHLSGWKTIIEETYKKRAVYLAAQQDNEIRGILPLCLVRGFPSAPHLVSLPYLSYAGLCTTDAVAANSLLAEAGSWRQRLDARYIELHNLIDFKPQISDWKSENSEYTSFKPQPGYISATNTDKVTMMLPLPDDSDTLWKGFKAKVRNQVKKATKSGLRVEVGDAKFLKSFYEVFAQNMRDLGSPVHKIQLFQNLFKVFSKDIRLFLVYKDSEPIGGAILLLFKETAEVPWASAKREYFSMCPNNLLYWEILRYACEQSIRTFDFGRSTKDSGTYRFKKQWGAVERPLYWQYYLPEGSHAPDTTHTSPAAKILINTWKKLPLRVANVLGPRVRGNISA